MSKLYFFRHAQASYLADDYDKLSINGEAQSVELGKYLLEKNIRFDKIFVGPLSRQKHTFEIVADVFSKHTRSLPEPEILPELKEHSGPEALKVAFPDLIENVPKVRHWYQEAKENTALRKRNNLLAFQYFMEEWVEGKIEVADIEPWKTFRDEVKKGLASILKNTGKGETIGVFTSGGTISSITAEALKIPDEKRVAAMNFSIRNTSFSTFLYSRERFNLLSFNEIPHLLEEMITFV